MFTMFGLSVVPRTQTKVTSLQPVPAETSCITWRLFKVTRFGMAAAREKNRTTVVYCILKWVKDGKQKQETILFEMMRWKTTVYRKVYLPIDNSNKVLQIVQIFRYKLPLQFDGNCHWARIQTDEYGVTCGRNWIRGQNQLKRSPMSLSTVLSRPRLSE